MRPTRKISQVSDKKRVIAVPKISLLEEHPPAIFASRLATREGNSKKPVYQIHKWWARRLGAVFRSILLSAVTPKDGRALKSAFYERQDLSGFTVLDPFVGGGTSIVEASKCNASVIGVDIDPVACFVTSMELAAFDESELQKSFVVVENAVKEEILRWYQAILPDGRTGTIVYAFWVDIIECRNCQTKTQAHPHYQLSRDRSNKKQVVFCSQCGNVDRLPLRKKTFECSSCNHSTHVEHGPIRKGVFTCPACGTSAAVNSFSSALSKPTQDLFALEVVPEGTSDRVFKKADASDKKLYQDAQATWRASTALHAFVPQDQIPTLDRIDSRPISYGYKFYRELFNDRQLLALSTLAKVIKSVEPVPAREFLATAFSDALAANNMFCYYAFDYHKLTPLFGLHAYQKITRPVENNVWGSTFGRGSFTRCFQKLLKAKRYCQRPFEYIYGKDGSPRQIFTGEQITPELKGTSVTNITNGSATAVLLNQSSENLTQIPAKSIDLILSDPPYYDNLAYSELSDFYHVWLKLFQLPSYLGNDQAQTPMHDSLYVSPKKSTSVFGKERFEIGLSRVFSEGYRVLKDEGLFAFTFHHRQRDAWVAIAIALTESKFRVTRVFPVRSEGNSRFHSSAGNLKWDIVFCCRKRNSVDGDALTIRQQNNLGNRIWRDARKAVSGWRRKILRSKLSWGEADQLSLLNAMAVAEISKYPVTQNVVRQIFTMTSR